MSYHDFVLLIIKFDIDCQNITEKIETIFLPFSNNFRHFKLFLSIVFYIYLFMYLLIKLL